MSTFDLNKLEELAEKATPGPWKINETQENEQVIYVDNHTEVDGVRTDFATVLFEADWASPEDVEFIVALINSFPAIVKRLKAAEKLEEALEEAECDCHGKVPYLCQRCKALSAYREAIKE